jgi:ribose-phosphate pyrophosphokinase
MHGEEIAYAWWGYDGGADKVEFLDIGRYPDGSPYVKEAGKLSVDGANRVLLRPKDMTGFMGGVFWIQSLIERGFRAPELILPCVPGQRQDRINLTGDVLFTIKSVAKIINSLGCPKVTILDPHSEATSALIDRCHVIHVDDIWAHHNPPGDQGYRAVIAPDAGASKRAARMADLLKIPLKQAKKKRDVSTGKLQGFECEDLVDLFHDNEAEPGSLDVPRVLVVDDLIDAGGTFIGLGEVLDAAGVDADLYVTHGLFTKGTRDVGTWYRKLICTDSVSAQRPDVEILFTAEQLLTTGEL